MALALRKARMMVVGFIFAGRWLLRYDNVAKLKVASFQDETRRSLEPVALLRASFSKVEGCKIKILLEGVGYIYADLGLEAGGSLGNQTHCATSRPFSDSTSTQQQYYNQCGRKHVELQALDWLRLVLHRCDEIANNWRTPKGGHRATQKFPSGSTSAR